MPFAIIIDGPNFINDLNRYFQEEVTRTKYYIMNRLSFPIIHGLIQKELKEKGLYSHPFLGTEFICANKSQIGPFRGQERTDLLSKLKREIGVKVREVALSPKEGGEKGVDMTVFVRMLHLGRTTPVTHVVLFASDKDYIPALEELRDLGIHTIVVGFKTMSVKGTEINYSEELINESYLYINLKDILDRMDERINTTIPDELKCLEFFIDSI